MIDEENMIDPFGDPEFVEGYNEWLDKFWSPNRLNNFEAMLTYYKSLEEYAEKIQVDFWIRSNRIFSEGTAEF